MGNSIRSALCVSPGEDLQIEIEKIDFEIMKINKQLKVLTKTVEHVEKEILDLQNEVERAETLIEVSERINKLQEFFDERHEEKEKDDGKNIDNTLCGEDSDISSGDQFIIPIYDDKGEKRTR